MNFSEEATIIKKSGLFDEKWYLEQYPDVRALGMDPVEHYLWLGARLMRKPSPHFDTAFYLKRNADVARAMVNPFLHYVRRGKQEGRDSIDKSETVDPAQKIPMQELQNVLGRMGVGAKCPAIIIPIYNAPSETEDCIKSLLIHTPKACKIILINDCSPDPGVKKVLKKYEADERVVVSHNEKNLGFTKTVNRGIEIGAGSDVVFLNSDTKVTPLWLRNLQLAAYSGDQVGTATPFSNNAGAFSAPQVGVENPLPKGLDLDQYARLVARSSNRSYPKVPTGNGFCMYIRRDCIDEVGSLDDQAFPRGYGEENDFCMRAGRAGWSHVIDDATLIYHVRSASFGDEKTPLMKAGREIIDQRYPEYTKSVRGFLSDTAVKAARLQVAHAISASRRKVPFGPGSSTSSPPGRAGHLKRMKT